MKETEHEKRQREFWSNHLRDACTHQMGILGCKGLVMVVIGAPWMGANGRGNTMGIAGSADLDPGEPAVVLRQMADIIDQQAKRIQGLMDRQKAGERIDTVWEPSEEN